MLTYQLTVSSPPVAGSGRTYAESYPVELTADGSRSIVLQLPFRLLPDNHTAIALLMTLQSPFAVIDQINDLLAQSVRRFKVDTVIGMPTLGFTLAEGVARRLNQPNFVALTNSKKFWQDQDLSVSVSSITSTTSKMLYLDQYLVSRITGKRVVIIDDVVSTGGSVVAAINLIKKARPSAIYVATVLSEGKTWQPALETIGFDWQSNALSLGRIPMFTKEADGSFVPIPQTL